MPDGQYSIHVCKPCEEGYIQPSDNTTDKCYLPPPDDEKVPDEEVQFTPSEPQEDLPKPGMLYTVFTTKYDLH